MSVYEESRPQYGNILKPAGRAYRQNKKPKSFRACPSSYQRGSGKTSTAKATNTAIIITNASTKLIQNARSISSSFQKKIFF
jgi:hypothetical protein